MDILGFLVVVAAFAWAHQHQLITTSVAALRQGRQEARKFWHYCMFQYTCFLANKTVWMLVVSAVVQTILLWVANRSLTENGVPATHWWIAVAFIALQLLYGLFLKLFVVPRFQRDGDGRLIRHPEFQQDANEHWLDADGDRIEYDDGTPISLDEDGRALRYYQVGASWFDAETGDAVNEDDVDEDAVLSDDDRRVPHVLANIPMYDNTRLFRLRRNRLERFSYFWPLLLTMGSSLFMCGTLLWTGAVNETRVPVGFAAAYFALAMTFLYANAAVIAWTIDKGTKLLEFAATFVARQGGLGFVGITAENMNQIRVDILNEEKIAELFRKVPVFLAINFVLYFTPVFLVPDTWVASTTLGLLFLRAFWDWRLARLGGGHEVQQDRFELTRIIRKLVPWLYLAAVLLWTHDGIRTAIKSQANMTRDLILRILNGSWGFNTPEALTLIGLVIGSLVGIWIFGGDEGVRKWVRNGFYGTALIGFVLLLCRVAGVERIGLARTPEAIITPNAPRNVQVSLTEGGLPITVRWTDNSTNEKSFIVERRTENSAWQERGMTDENRVGWSDKEITFGVQYQYRVIAVGEGNGRSKPAYSRDMVSVPAPKPTNDTKTVIVKKTVQEETPAADTAGKVKCSAKQIALYKSLHDGRMPSRCL